MVLRAENFHFIRMSHSVSSDEEMELFKKYSWSQFLEIRWQCSVERWWLSWPLTLNTGHDFHWTYSTNCVRWTMSDGKHGNIAEGPIHEGSAAHFFDRVTTLCKACGSRVLQSAQGTIKPTARSTHGPPCPTDRDKVVGTARSFGRPAALEQRDMSLFMTGARLQCFIHSNRGICDPWSNTGFISASAAVVLGGPPVRQRQHWWLGETKLMLTEVRASGGHVWTGDKVKRWNPSGSHLETEERGSRSDKWSVMRRALSKFDKNPKLGHGSRSASQECTLLSRGILCSLFLAPQLELNHYNPFIGLDATASW